MILLCDKVFWKLCPAGELNTSIVACIIVINLLKLKSKLDLVCDKVMDLFIYKVDLFHPSI